MLMFNKPDQAAYRRWGQLQYRGCDKPTIRVVSTFRDVSSDEQLSDTKK